MNIMAILTALIAGICLVLCYKKTRTILYPGVVFNTIWLVAIILNQINHNHFYSVSEYTYFVIFLGIICFNISFIGLKTKFGQNTNNCDNVSVKKKSGKKIFVIQVVIFIALIPLFIRSISYRGIYGNSMFRTVYANGVEYGYMTTFERLLYIHFVIFPLNMVTNGLQIILWTRGVTKLRYLMLGLLNMVLIIFCSGNRGDVLIVMLFLIFAVGMSDSFRNKARHNIKKMKKSYKFLIIAGFIALILFSIQRGNFGEDGLLSELMKLVTTNFSGGINLLDIAISDPSQGGLNTFLFGLASTNGILSVLLFALRIITLGRINIELPSITEYSSAFHAVSATTKMNAYTTVFYTFMQDLGLFGVILLSVVFGAIAVMIYKSFIRTPLIKHSMYLLITLIIVFYTVVSWQLTSSHIAVMYFHAWWLSKVIGVDKSKIHIKFH